MMPVWLFALDAGDVLLSSAKLWDTDLLLEALRVHNTTIPRRCCPRATSSAAEPTPRVPAGR